MPELAVSAEKEEHVKTKKGAARHLFNLMTRE